MSITVYVVSAIVVFVFSGLLAMAGVGAAFLFVPLFHYLGVPLAEAAPTALLLNVVSLFFGAINYWRGKPINWSMGVPVLIMAVSLSPVGARLTPFVNKEFLLALLAAFLIFAGAMMLFRKVQSRQEPLSRTVELAAGAGVGDLADRVNARMNAAVSATAGQGAITVAASSSAGSRRRTSGSPSWHPI